MPFLEGFSDSISVIFTGSALGQVSRKSWQTGSVISATLVTKSAAMGEMCPLGLRRFLEGPGLQPVV